MHSLKGHRFYSWQSSRSVCPHWAKRLYLPFSSYYSILINSYRRVETSVIKCVYSECEGRYALDRPLSHRSTWFQRSTPNALNMSFLLLGYVLWRQDGVLWVLCHLLSKPESLWLIQTEPFRFLEPCHLVLSSRYKRRRRTWNWRCF